MTRIWVERKEEIIKTGISPIFPPFNPFTSHTETNIMLGAIQFKTESDKRMYFPEQWLIPRGFSERRNAKFLKYVKCSSNIYFVMSCSVSWQNCSILYLELDVANKRYTFHFCNLWAKNKNLGVGIEHCILQAKEMDFYWMLLLLSFSLMTLWKLFE